jgi:hypothetical protein
LLEYTWAICKTRSPGDVKIIGEAGLGSGRVFYNYVDSRFSKLLALPRCDRDSTFSREGLTWNSNCCRQTASVSKSSFIATAKRKSWLRRSVYNE